ncbi:MAG: amidohydrolase family protein [Thermoplasmata archaeon]
MIVRGAILDADGPRRAYVRIEGGRVTETGSPGTESAPKHVRRIPGIVTPWPWNGHSHLGDAVSVREPPPVPFSEMVAPPEGYKFRLLRDASPAAKRSAMRAALRGMAREGIAGTIDFREEGLPGVRLLRQAARGRAGSEAVVLGRPVGSDRSREEIDRILDRADGIGLSSCREEGTEVRRRVAEACRSRGKRYALHASEEVREDPAVYLDPRPDLLVHLTRAEEGDLDQVVAEGVTVAVCPRSNALFGRAPLLSSLERRGARVVLGTDNAMLLAPSIWRELEFAYVQSRALGRPASAAFLARAALVEPWRWVGREAEARIGADSPAHPLVHRLPPEDPAYQVVTRAAEHLMLRPAGPPRESSEDRHG